MDRILAVNTNSTTAIQFTPQYPLPFNFSISLKLLPSSESTTAATFSPQKLVFQNGFSTTPFEYSNRNITIHGIEPGYLSFSFELVNENTGGGDIPNEYKADYTAAKERLSSPLTLHVINVQSRLIDSLLLSGTILFGFSIGCSFPFTTLQTIFKKDRAKGIAAATLSQFIVVPATTFLLVKAFNLSPEMALGAVVLAASPGGNIAPVFTYFMGGDMALSVSIGIVATSLATVFIPLILYLVSLLYPAVAPFIPWLLLSLTLLGLLVPVFIGMLVLHYKPTWAYYISRSAAFWGAFVVVCSVVIGILTWKEMFLSNWEVYVTAIIVGVVSIGTGTGFSYLFRLTPFQLRAVLMQTTLLNSPLALSILQLAFSRSCAPLIQLFPLFYSLWMLVMAIVVALVCCFAFPVIPDKDLVLRSESEAGGNTNSAGNGGSVLPFHRTRGNSFTAGLIEATQNMIPMVSKDQFVMTHSMDRKVQNALKTSAESSDALNAGSYGNSNFANEKILGASYASSAMGPTPPNAYVTPMSMTPVGGNFSSLLGQIAFEDDVIDKKKQSLEVGNTSGVGIPKGKETAFGLGRKTSHSTIGGESGFETPGSIFEHGQSSGVAKLFAISDWIPTSWSWGQYSTNSTSNNVAVESTEKSITDHALDNTATTSINNEPSSPPDTLVPSSPASLIPTERNRQPSNRSEFSTTSTSTLRQEFSIVDAVVGDDDDEDGDSNEDVHYSLSRPSSIRTSGERRRVKFAEDVVPPVPPIPQAIKQQQKKRKEGQNGKETIERHHSSDDESFEMAREFQQEVPHIVITQASNL
ncbi:hypothetical protein HK098_000494 [Nowakowskiella sp. JEL0407]|nr:hypothetical protein HK098_000494 [Nowakowskiella sp. JEL0407]